MNHKAITTLFSEHESILDAISIVNKLNSFTSDKEQYFSGVGLLLRFFKEFADQLHHAKEELVLFPAMEKSNDTLGTGILHEMLENHESFREKIIQIETEIKNSNVETTKKLLHSYVNDLLEHIEAENQEVFQIAQNMLTENELDKIYFHFVDLDTEKGNDKINELKLLLLQSRQIAENIQ